MRSKKVIIIGGGFGGLNAAKKLAGEAGVEVTLIDRRNYHLFQPLLYQVAAAGLSPAEIAVPIRSIFSDFENLRVVLGNVEAIDLKAKTVTDDFGRHEYDRLILACGAKHSYFGHPEWEEFAPGLKTLEQATEIRRRIFLAFENAERETDPIAQKKFLTFVIVGGGPTGVELAGALGEISRYTLADDFHNIDPQRTRVILIEAGRRILPSFSEELSRKAARDLESLGVQVWTSSRVIGIDASGVTLGPGEPQGVARERIETSTVLWAAGVQPSSLNRQLNAQGVTLDKAGRVIVAPDLSIPLFPDVFVLGDQACLHDTNGKPLPGLAPVAMQEGRAAAANILNDFAGLPRKPFHYVDKGQMATIGRRKAVAEFAGRKLSGLLAWLTWLLVHVYYLIGFKNRLFVLYQWFWSYFTYKRGARLIIGKEWRSVPKVDGN